MRFSNTRDFPEPYKKLKQRGRRPHLTDRYDVLRKIASTKMCDCSGKADDSCSNAERPIFGLPAPSNAQRRARGGFPKVFPVICAYIPVIALNKAKLVVKYAPRGIVLGNGARRCFGLAPSLTVLVGFSKFKPAQAADLATRREWLPFCLFYFLPHDTCSWAVGSPVPPPLPNTSSARMLLRYWLNLVKDGTLQNLFYEPKFPPLLFIAGPSSVMERPPSVLGGTWSRTSLRTFCYRPAAAQSSRQRDLWT
ncbi:hypothetical protein BJY52DRAFT_1253509 [Lactarius psammicola]|nr:hypothetical protein BJY52DRAFT_1253509 [Lactarius psammicola]